MAMIKKPNTLCRNINCTNGDDGGRKYFYACLSCLRNESWRAYCCSIECYDAYIEAILKSRSVERKDRLPERTDMTVSEMEEVLKKPKAEVYAYTAEHELKEYMEENPYMVLSDIVDLVNKDIDEDKKKTRKRK